MLILSLSFDSNKKDRLILYKCFISSFLMSSLLLKFIESIVLYVCETFKNRLIII
jgi:hypothetical protein